jgi:hypothetical protein
MATVIDSDSGHGTEGLTRLMSGTQPDTGTFAIPANHPQAIMPPAPTGPRTHGPKLKTPLPEEARGFRRVTHGN